MIAIGILDTLGYIASVEALDTCLKAADVQLVSCEKIKGGIVSLTITGDVAAVTSAIQAAVAAAQRLDGYRNHTIIARIDKQTDLLYETASQEPQPVPYHVKEQEHDRASKPDQAPAAKSKASSANAKKKRDTNDASAG